MHTNFDAETLYSPNAINAMTKMTYGLYQPQASGRIYLISIVLMLCGAIGMTNTSNALFVVLLLIGCWLYVSVDRVPKNMAKRIIASMNKSFPTMKFSFRQDNILVTTPKESGEVQYSILHRLAEDKRYFYLFSNARSAYVVDKLGFTHGTADEFRTFIQEKLGITIERAPSIPKKLLAAMKRQQSEQ